MYAEAGYSKQNPLLVELRYNTSENHKKIALAVSAMWKYSLGVETTLINEEWKVFLQNRQQKQLTQVFRAGWIGDYNDPFSFAELMHSRYGINDTGYHNPQYDQLLDAAEIELDTATRRSLLQRAEAILLRDHPVIPMFFYVSKSLIKPLCSRIRRQYNGPPLQQKLSNFRTLKSITHSFAALCFVI